MNTSYAADAQNIVQIRSRIRQRLDTKDPAKTSRACRGEAATIGMSGEAFCRFRLFGQLARISHTYRRIADGCEKCGLAFRSGAGLTCCTDGKSILSAAGSDRRAEADWA